MEREEAAVGMAHQDAIGLGAINILNARPKLVFQEGEEFVGAASEKFTARRGLSEV